MQITDPKSHSLHNHHLKINCTDQIISLLEYLPVESSLTSGIDKLLQSHPITHSSLTAVHKEELTGCRGIDFPVLMHVFTHNIKYGATENQQVALPMPFSMQNCFCGVQLILPDEVMGLSRVLVWKKAGSEQLKHSSFSMSLQRAENNHNKNWFWPALLSSSCAVLCSYTSPSTNWERLRS